MADTKVSQLPTFTGGTSPRAADLLLVVDTLNSTYVSRSATIGSLSGLVSGLSLQVDGVVVPPTSGAINFVDSVAQLNRVQFSNTATNRIAANLDPTSPLYTAELSISNLAGTQSISIDYPDSATVSYDIVLPANQGAVGQVMVNDGAGNLTWQTVSGGGGGAVTATSVWTGGTANKNAYTSPGVVNNVGITISLEATSGSGGITAATIRLNGVALAGTFNSTGAWPNLTIAIPAATLSGNVAETAATVVVSLTGTFNSTGLSISNAGTLTNTQPTPFTTTLTGSYALSSAPYYTTTGTLNYSYSNGAAITSFGGVLTPGGNATSTTGSFTNIALTGSTISGSATGNGLNGAGSSTVTLSGSVAAVPSFIPAFWGQTTTNSPPTFTTSSNQTGSAAQGSTITYTLPSASTNYNWVCTQRPLANLMLRTSFGTSVLVPDVTAPNQTIAGQTFQCYGWTALATDNPSILVIS